MKKIINHYIFFKVLGTQYDLRLEDYSINLRLDDLRFTIEL
jgi:hypothetical protein